MCGVTGKQCKIYIGVRKKRKEKENGTKVILGIYWSDAELYPTI